MPNHFHLVILPRDGESVGKLIGDFKSKSAFKIIQKWKKENNVILKKLVKNKNSKKTYKFWLPRCYDHNCRTPETVLEKINYCHMNPLKKGLVENPGEWKWSSYNWYQGERDDLIEVDEISLL